MAVGLVATALALLYPKLPSLDAVTDYRPKLPLRVYTVDHQLIGEFGEERRAVLKLDQVPLNMQHAILAAEDDRFYQHGAVDFQGVLRAMMADIFSRSAKEGASTITMQVARNFFLTNERTLTRKLSEVLLSYKIEQNISKNHILELYINQIYLGQRAYGFGSAAVVYYGKPLAQLSVAEMAMLAGLPKAPSRYNPIINPQRAALRQQYVLRRMHELKFISDADYTQALHKPGHASVYHANVLTQADYVAEMVRQYMIQTYGDSVYTSGDSVITTLIKANQEAAVRAVREGVLAYDQRHGYRGPEATVDLPVSGATNADFEDALSDTEIVNTLYPAIVESANEKEVSAYIKNVGLVSLKGNSLSFVHTALSPHGKAALRLQRGSMIRVMASDKLGWAIVQLPKAESSLVSLDSRDGAIRALVGGFDFNRTKYNHVTQAFRQPGSSFKPFIYSAALEKGFTPFTVVDDGPLVINNPKLNNGKPWEPHNYENEYSGPMRLRVALAKSINTVAVRVLQAIGPDYAQNYVKRFGFDAAHQPAYLSMALGAGEATPLQMATAYTVFANGGFRVKPYFIDKILDNTGHVISQTQPIIAGEGAEQVIDPRNAFILTSMMKDVVRMGTAAKAMSLGRHDLAGKTGTTNDHVDAWFCGFQPSLVAVAWIGFDKPSSLGSQETGAQAALPIWMKYMASALKTIPDSDAIMPPGIDMVAIDPATGQPSTAPDHIDDYAYAAAAQSN